MHQSDYAYLYGNYIWLDNIISISIITEQTAGKEQAKRVVSAYHLHLFSRVLLLLISWIGTCSSLSLPFSVLMLNRKGLILILSIGLFLIFKVQWKFTKSLKEKEDSKKLLKRDGSFACRL